MSDADFRLKCLHPYMHSPSNQVDLTFVSRVAVKKGACNPGKQTLCVTIQFQCVLCPPYRYVSFHSQPSRPQVSTEALLKTKTDWLRQFRETLPLSSQLNLSSGARQSLLHGGSGLGSTTAAVNRSSTLTREPHSYKPPSGATLLPSKPKLTLDGSRNTQLAQPQNLMLVQPYYNKMCLYSTLKPCTCR